ncbi:MAG TPA: hypothetical protein VG168_08105 [Bryobacteraceae bacterium]|nr:hypothetical protein [Bryobacteraceae bacterium]
MRSRKNFLRALLALAISTLAFAQSNNTAVDERISRICNGLEYTITINGISATGMTLWRTALSNRHAYRMHGSKWRCHTIRRETRFLAAPGSYPTVQAAFGRRRLT